MTADLDAIAADVVRALARDVRPIGRLTWQESALVRLLETRPDRCWPAEYLAALLSKDPVASTATADSIRQVVKNIRKKEPDIGRQIVTRKGFGYQWCAPLAGARR